MLDIEKISAAKSGNIEPTSHNRDFAKQNWLEDRQAEIAFEGREPDVLVVGGGHAGISAAVELKRLGLDTLVIDKQQRVGDNWRLRYHGLKLHNKTPVNHLRYMPFPPNWPDYIPKDKIANWLEAYVESMEVNFWTRMCVRGRRIRRGNAILDGAGPARRRQRSHAASEAYRDGDQRQRHAQHSKDRDDREFRRQGAAFQPVFRRRGVARQIRAW